MFVHGWGMNSAVWASFIERLPAHVEPVCIDLPGHGEFNQCSFNDLQELTDHLQTQSEQRLDGSAIWVGWSLGALPVLKLAMQSPEKVSKLMLVASNPCFVKREDWENGVEESVFDLFADNLQANIEKTLQRFLSLQVQGMSDAREVLRVLRQAIVTQGLPSTEALIAGLHVLKTTDLRSELSNLNIPQTWLLGEKDTLVPASLNESLNKISGVKSHIIGGSAHLPFISHTEAVLQQLLDVIND